MTITQAQDRVTRCANRLSYRVREGYDTLSIQRSSERLDRAITILEELTQANATEGTL